MILFLIAVFGLAAGNLQLDEGDPCTAKDGGRGICTLFSSCTTLGDYTKNFPINCGFKGKEAIVCCPNYNSKTFKKIEELCSWMQDTCLDNLDPTVNVMNGTESKPKEHPYMVLIGYEAENKLQWRCGGTIITSRYVLSAAHCSEPPGLGPAKWARLGELVISSTSDDARPIDKSITDRIRYPKYKPSQNYHDIALFKLNSDVVFNSYISPICLKIKRQTATKYSTVVGWGTFNKSSNATSDKLLEANLEIYNDTECNRLVFAPYNSISTPRGHDSNTMVCAGKPDGSKDTCEGDSGGPLIVHDTGSCIRTQIGITSYGRGCANPDLPGVYTRVSNYISWIEEVAFGNGIQFLFNI